MIAPSGIYKLPRSQLITKTNQRNYFTYIENVCWFVWILNDALFIPAQNVSICISIRISVVSWRFVLSSDVADFFVCGASFPYCIRLTAYLSDRTSNLVFFYKLCKCSTIEVLTTLTGRIQLALAQLLRYIWQDVPEFSI